MVFTRSNASIEKAFPAGQPCFSVTKGSTRVALIDWRKTSLTSFADIRFIDRINSHNAILAILALLSNGII